MKYAVLNSAEIELLQQLEKDFSAKINKNVNYDYIIIDEYQDVSKQKYKFIKKLSDLYDAKILAVCDDWQSIFEFSGSEVSIFTNFFNIFWDIFLCTL